MMERIEDPITIRLLDDWQRDLPLETRPFANIGAALGCDEQEVLRRLGSLRADGRITRVGATCAPNTISASTLAAVAAPADHVEEVAEIIGQQPGVNHSYQRENRWNLWFVATGPDRAHIDDVLARIGRETGLAVLDVPLLRPFNVDLGFRMSGPDQPLRPRREIRPDAIRDGDRALLQMLTEGMPLVATPYREIAQALGRTEAEIIDRIAALQEAGILTRLGVIVRHRALGWSSNAMVVWDIAPERVTAAGPALAAHPGVTLCYERRPDPARWPYRLYCMIHAKTRKAAMDILAGATELPELEGVPYRVLFSCRCFKQMGAMVAPNREVAA